VKGRRTVNQPRVLLVDNHDSFTWNLAQALGALGAEVEVALSDRLTGVDTIALRFDAVVISPGPGRPEDAGASVPVVRAVAGRLPVLGVCLGHQAIAQAYGASILRANRLVHGKTSPVVHDGRGVFAGMPSPFEATRYHSLTVDPASMPSELSVCAETEDGTIMGVRHRSEPTHGVQFHPESVLTTLGGVLLANFLSLAAARLEAAR
jgi:anthranilate synthase/aminodeoxychorismate synthase-like glutamine amidotransferase